MLVSAPLASGSLCGSFSECGPPETSRVWIRAQRGHCFCYCLRSPARALRPCVPNIFSTCASSPEVTCWCLGLRAEHSKNWTLFGRHTCSTWRRTPLLRPMVCLLHISFGSPSFHALGLLEEYRILDLFGDNFMSLYSAHCLSNAK